MNREFLYELLETASVSGFEEEIQRKVIKYARGFADEIYTDEIADVVSIVNPDAEIKVMLSAHMDWSHGIAYYGERNAPRIQGGWYLSGNLSWTESQNHA